MKTHLKKLVHWALLPLLCAVLCFALPFGDVTANAATERPELRMHDVGVSPEVEAKVDEIAAACRAAGVTDEYDIAVWLHDWLVYNARYDYTYTHYDPDGVLLYGSGVCQSYTDAYALLLDEFGIENQDVTGRKMNHTWNLVKLNGEWCHIDCTWDDPSEEPAPDQPEQPIVSGQENYSYFGLTDEMMRRDHKWESEHPAANSTVNIYYLRTGMTGVSSKQDLYDYLGAMADAKVEQFQVYYIGGKTEFNAMSLLDQWFEQNARAYGLTGYNCSGGAYSLQVNFTYAQPAITYDLTGPNGRYQQSVYSKNGLVLVFGTSTCRGTAMLLDAVNENNDALEAAGTLVLVDLTDCADQASLKASGVLEKYPNVHFVYHCADVMEQCRALAYNDMAPTPHTYLFGSHTSYAGSLLGPAPTEMVLGYAYMMGSGKPVPAPEKTFSFAISGTAIDKSAASITEPEGGWTPGENTFTVTSEKACTVLVSTDGGNTYTRLAVGSKGDGSASFTAELDANTTIEVALSGDVNGDGNLRNSDVIQLKAAALGKLSLDSLHKLVGDVNNDGNLRNSDVIQLKAAALGKLKLPW